MALHLLKEEVPQTGEQPTPTSMHFSLEGILPAHQVLALDPSTKVLMLLSRQGERPQALLTHILTTGEYFVLLPLLDSYPYYCPYELMLASFRGRITEAAVTLAQRQLQEAIETGTWDQEMRPTRAALSRLRAKLRQMGLDAVSVFATGYILQATHWAARKHEVGQGRR